MVKKSIFYLRIKLQSLELSISTNSVKLLPSTSKLVQCHDSEYYSLKATDDDPILVYILFKLTSKFYKFPVAFNSVMSGTKNTFVNTKKF